MELVQTSQFRIAQAGTVLVVDRPPPGQAITFNAEPYRVIDLRPVVGEWQSLVRVGDDLRIIFPDGSTIALLDFFEEGADEKLVQVSDTVFYSPYSMLLAYTIVEEGRAVDPITTSLNDGGYFVATPEPEPLGVGLPLALLFESDLALLADDPPPDLTGGGTVFTSDDDPNPDPGPPDPSPEPPNRPPELTRPISDQSSPEDTLLTLSLPSDLFVDPDGDPLAYTVTLSNGDPLPPQLVFDSVTGTLSGTPPQDFNGSVELRITASDGSLSTSATFTLDITPVNDPPVASPVDLGTTPENGTRVITQAQLLAGVTDVDGPTLTITDVELTGGGGTLVDNGDGTWSYTPAPGDDEVSFSYTVSDGTDTASSSATLDVDPPVNGPPVANPVDLGTIEEDGSRTITEAELLAAASDPDTDALEVTDVSIATGGGTLVDNGDGTWTYTPDPDDDTDVTFNYTVSDGTDTASSTASLDITPVNDPPVASPVDLGAVVEDGTRVITEASLLAGVSDPDGPSLAIVSLTVSSGNGSLVDNGDGTWTYTPALDDDTAVTFNYTVTDGTDTASSTANLDITPVNDPPVATPVNLGTVAENGSRTISDDELLAGVTDVDGPSLSITGVSIATGGGSLTDNGDGTWTYTPAPDDESEVTFNYTASDSIDSGSSTATLDITPGASGPPGLDLDGNDSNGGGFDYTSAFTMGGPGIPIADTDVTITYPGGTSLTSATISMIANGQVPPNDVLSISGALPGGIVASAYNPATATITLTGTASIDDYEAALQQVVFSTPDAFFNADRIISVTVADGAVTSNTAQTFMHVVSVLQDFEETDTIDLSVLLDDLFEPPAQVSDFARLVQDGTDIVLQVDRDGTGTGFDWRDVAVLPGYGTPGPDIVNVFFEGATHQLTV